MTSPLTLTFCALFCLSTIFAFHEDGNAASNGNVDTLVCVSLATSCELEVFMFLAVVGGSCVTSDFIRNGGTTEGLR